MKNRPFKVGERVKLLEMPDWLINDLPADEQAEMKRFVGLVTEITVIKPDGYFWLEFGEILEVGDTAYCSGHSFCVNAESIELEK
jgi:hypothetical protein